LGVLKVTALWNAPMAMTASTSHEIELDLPKKQSFLPNSSLTLLQEQQQ
jgi:hypothetical protein